MTKVASVRLDDDVAALVDQLAADRGMTRSDWLALIVDRALVGEGRMDADEAVRRRDRRFRPKMRTSPSSYL